MEKNLKKQSSWNFERTALILFSVVFIGVMIGAWISAMSLRQTIAAKNSVVNIDARALVEVEQLRNVIESKISNSRSFFLLGSRVLFDEQKKEQQVFKDALANFEKQFTLPGVPEILKRLSALSQQEQDIFDQAMKFREDQTEAKIIGQFYQSKTVPVRAQFNDALSGIVRIHNAELDHARERARAAAMGAEAQIPRGMIWLTSLTTLLFLGMALLVIRMLGERTRQQAERTRLYEEATKAVQSRDEVMVAVSYDLKEPLSAINDAVESITDTSEPSHIREKLALIKSSVIDAESVVKNILDQAKSEMGSMALRLDQIGINDILGDARLMLQPLAKTRDIRLQFDLANPPVLAFFDRERVLRVLSNLVGNAIKFSPRHGKVAIRVRSDQQQIYVSVADTGPGIPEKQIPGIFDNFWQARKTADQGAGVGLAVVKTIVEAHGGTVRADSQPGTGTTFTFTLPRRRPVGAVLRGPTPTVRPSPRSPSSGEINII